MLGPGKGNAKLTKWGFKELRIRSCNGAVTRVNPMHPTYKHSDFSGTVQLTKGFASRLNVKIM